MGYKPPLRYGIALLVVAALAFVAFMLYLNSMDKEWTLLNEPLHVVNGRTITDSFTVPANTTYEMNIYVQEKVPYADCLLGQTNSYPDVSPLCTRRHSRAIDVAWVLHGKDGSVLRKGLSGGTCCSYTTDEHNNRVVSTMLDAFTLTSGTSAYLELQHRRNVQQLARLAPRIVVERTSEDSESAGVTELFAILAMIVIAAIGGILLLIGLLQYRAYRKQLKSAT